MLFNVCVVVMDAGRYYLSSPDVFRKLQMLKDGSTQETGSPHTRIGL